MAQPVEDVVLSLQQLEWLLCQGFDLISGLGTSTHRSAAKKKRTKTNKQKKRLSILLVYSFL